MDETLEAGKYVIVQRQKYTKVYKLQKNGILALGNRRIEMSNVIGHRYFDTFKIVLSPDKKNLYTLEKTENVTSASELDIEESGEDNRNITDDRSSQALSKEDIDKLRDEALGSSEMIEKLITNSKSFKLKTKMSQEKYISKKEKKYFEYIQIRKPTIRLLAETYYRLDPSKVLGVRIDDLSQILTYSNVQSDGNFLLYDSGTSGLISAAIMNAIGANTTGKLVHAHPGNECQKAAFLAMNFPKEQVERCINVNLYSVLRWYYQGDVQKNDESKDETEVNNQTKEEQPTVVETSKDEENEAPKGIKRTHNDQENSTSGPSAKRPCWHFDNQKACEILKDKIDALIIVAKEHPESIVEELVQFLNPSRALVVFSMISEPLEDLYVYLKKRSDFVNIRVTNNFMRYYQVLPERTHPEITMNFGGYLLSATKIKF
ncbi:tRNA (adenine(58)-N(1))-methyltransferase non-catalytic subunit TRM6-like [Agrilus planipennis]|uniref:tRNA (adenine(58)-N(1))-methyltransferase non-catalytic subunit TRM6 n=1 Tax=Agrilus planipennis TaxID=224129 RepID=A0A7F5R063_AGRPL|nr:tRNA (adenine(58)-N(1))-methyltransferase non-catalytic subunit TRM6 [Agrilus planipennis]XP_025830992.1 tRNA (adenine(58)-N(1))-methyltransferase non-catalytic subunit TRM6-like [Agrilus planipennis]